MTTDLFRKRFIIVAGKGGTGKTSLSLALGFLFAKRGKRTLVCLCNAQPRYSQVLRGLHLDSAIRQLAPFLGVVNLDPMRCQEEYGAMVLRNPVLHRIVFRSRTVRTFLDAVPGLAEWAMLGKATFHALANGNRSPEYDAVIFDAPATGHGLEILSLPSAIASAIPAGRIREEANARVHLLEDPECTEVIPVTLPEELSVNETLELVAGIGKLKIAIERAVVNRVSSRAFSYGLNCAVDESILHGIVPAWFIPSAVALERIRAEAKTRDRLERALSVPIIELPDLYTMAGTADFLTALGAALSASLQKKNA